MFFISTNKNIPASFGSRNLIVNQFSKYSAGFEQFMKIITLRGIEIIMESLILAQNERWRRVLSMQVER